MKTFPGKSNEKSKQKMGFFFSTNKIGEERKKKNWNPLKRSILSLSNFWRRKKKKKQIEIFKRGPVFEIKEKIKDRTFLFGLQLFY